MDNIEIALSGPNTLPGRYIRQFWQPVYLSSDLAIGQAKPLKVLNEQFTIYRGQSGQPYVVGFRCAHRSTQLSTGWVEGDCLRCFYHGWMYDGSGQCVERPAETADPSKVCIPGYPTEEYLGLIFAFLGQGEPPEFPRFQRLEAPGVRDVTVDLMPVNFLYSLENDALHFAFTHRDLLPEKNLSGVPEVWAEESDWGITTYAKWPNTNRVGASQKGMPNVGYIVPSAIVLAKQGMKHALHASWRVPRDDESHYSFRINLVTMPPEDAQEFLAKRPANYNDRSVIRKYGDAVLAGDLRIEDIKDRTHIEFIQDYVVQVGQGSVENRRLERLGRTDASVVLLRKIWKREMAAFAEGRPLKQWRMTDKIEPVAGIEDLCGSGLQEEPMMTVQRQKPKALEEWYIKSAYQDFVRREGAPLYEGSAIENLATLPLADWERRGGKVGYTRLGEQENYNLQIVEIPAGGQLSPEHHMYDAIMFVLSGGGASTIWQPGEQKRLIEWEEGSLLAIPLNAWHQEFNRSSTEPCRVLFASNMAHAINLYNNIDFIFNNPYAFTDRYSYDMEEYLTEETQWERRLVETNFIADVRALKLDSFPERGNRTSIMRMAMAGTSLGMHLMGVSEGTYVTAHRHGSGAHVIVVAGEGYELLFNEGDEQRKKVAANPYAVVAPKTNEFHQHFNTGKGEYRMLAFRHNGLRYGWGTPYSNARTVQDKDRNAWAFKISYEQEDPAIREEYYKELETKEIHLRLKPLDQ